MSKQLLEIYRKRVLDHSRNPHNQRRPAGPDREVVGFNPLCGDKLTVYMSLDGDVLEDVAFEGTGCAISIASASMMTDALRGAPATEARALIDQVARMFSDGEKVSDPRLEEIVALENVRDYPSRIKCATLAWQAAASALTNQDNQISTE